MEEGTESDTEGVGKEMGQVQPVDVPAGLGWVAATATLITDKYFQDCYRMYFTEKHLEKCEICILVSKGLCNP